MSTSVVLCNRCAASHRPTALKMMRNQYAPDLRTSEGPYCRECVYERTAEVDASGGIVVELAPVELIRAGRQVSEE